MHTQAKIAEGRARYAEKQARSAAYITVLTNEFAEGVGEEAWLFIISPLNNNTSVYKYTIKKRFCKHQNQTFP